ncbi:hypothetical protein [Thermomonas paludicola]|uniref:hypothetical protein n=1 Tax=Thermomonas paludicola TaxID=2884874 RepID=UPI0021154D4B|nr:hypothetical protein [Thermomonas paludicola]
MKSSLAYGLAAISSWVALVSVTIALSIPFIGTVLANRLAELTGCMHVQDSYVQLVPDCSFIGINISERVSYYQSATGLLLTPLAFIQAFWDLFLLWLTVSILLSAASLGARESEQAGS